MSVGDDERLVMFAESRTQESYLGPRNAENGWESHRCACECPLRGVLSKMYVGCRDYKYFGLLGAA